MDASKVYSREPQERPSRMQQWIQRARGWLGSSRGDASPGAPRHPNLTRRARQGIAELLEGLGRFALPLEGESLDEIRKTYRDWAGHVERDEPSPRTGRRWPLPFRDRIDWKGLTSHVLRQRQGESRFLAGSLEDLRRSLWSLVTRVSQDLQVEKDSDRELGGQLERLREATRSESIQDLRREVLTAVESLDGLLSRRQGAQQDRLKALGAQLRLMRQELAEARREMQLDPLTRLFNRSAFDQTLEKVTSLNSVMGEPACLLMVDLDHFKKINDAHGHPAGDEVLRTTADLLIKVFPRKTDFVARYGGEEIAIILQQDDHSVARKLGERFLKRLREQAFQFGGTSIQVTASVGVAELEPSETAAAWLERADRALYEAKEAGRDRLLLGSSEPVPA